MQYQRLDADTRPGHCAATTTKLRCGAHQLGVSGGELAAGQYEFNKMGGGFKRQEKNLFNQPQLYTPSPGLAVCGEVPPGGLGGYTSATRSPILKLASARC